jgi:hypothetical protein
MMITLIFYFVGPAAGWGRHSIFGYFRQSREIIQPQRLSSPAVNEMDADAYSVLQSGAIGHAGRGKKP